MSAVHDMGGRPRDEPIDRSEHALMDWERRTNALVGALREKSLINTDELRRGIESIPAQEYESLTYYERWSASLELLLVERGAHVERDRRSGRPCCGRRWG